VYSSPFLDLLYNFICNSYKQNKFNLLREQSEGYSKLTAELTSSLGPAHFPATGRPMEPYSAIEERARAAWTKVISLIGFFDLDPNRTLDIILDVLSVHLATHSAFFISLLSFSPWAGAYRAATWMNEDMKIDKADVGLYRNKNLDEVLSIARSRAQTEHNSVTLSQRLSSGALAQVLGFKFAYYQVRVVGFVYNKSSSCLSERDRM
jgi:THO complex subunit 2